MKLLKIIFIISIIGIIIGCATQNYASKGNRYLNQKEYEKAINEFEKSLSIDTLPGSLSGMSRANIGLKRHNEAKKYLNLLKNKFPDHKFTPIQIDIWNKKFPNDTIAY